MKKIVDRLHVLDLVGSVESDSRDESGNVGYCLMCGCQNFGVGFEEQQKRCSACAEKAVYSVYVLKAILNGNNPKEL